jgi:predicted ATPase/class 3 adenylate cyclase
MTGAQPSGTVTLVFTDIEGSTRLLEQLGTDAYRDALAEHRRVVREACARHSGYEVDCEGDAFFVTFHTAPAAVAAVSEAMRGLEGGPIQIRVGIHTGQPGLDGPNYIGLDVHRAARIMAAAHGGQVVLSPSTAALLDGFELTDLGEHRLKDLTAPIRLRQLLIDGLPGEFPPLKTLYRSNLPVPATPFLGRETELAEVVQRLTDPNTRLLTLTGPGGTGKTRLALQAAAEAADHYPDGITWIPLASLREPEFVASTVTSALDLPQEPGAPLSALTGALEGKRALLVLDNMEHLLPEAARTVAELAAGCPELRMLVTSRERLAVDGEREVPVDALTRDDAVDLLLARAGALSVDIDRDADAEALVERLDRLPLAIELAAARVKLLTPRQLLARLGDRLDSLKGGRDVDPRQQTLRATIAWSHDLLSADEQRLFRRLAIFRGAYTVAAAEAICDAHIDDLQSLLDKSLLRRRDDGGEPRLWMLETIREFAAEQLEAAHDDRAAARRAHADWHYALAEPEHEHPWTATRDRLAALEESLDDLRAAYEELIAASDSPRALRMAVNLFPVWEVHDRFVEGDRWLERALELPGPELAAERGVALDARSSTANHLLRPEDSRRYAEQAVGILRSSGTPAQLAMAMQGLATSLEGADLRRALELGEAALGLARRSADPRVVRTAAVNLASCASSLADRDRAEALLAEGLALSRSLGDDPFVAVSLQGLADLELDRHRDAEAWRLYLEAAELAAELGARLVLAFAVAGLAASAARLGEPRMAGRLWASFEQWETERGARTQAVYRRRYASAIRERDTTGAGVEPAPTLEGALELARAWTPPTSGS